MKPVLALVFFLLNICLSFSIRASAAAGRDFNSNNTLDSVCTEPISPGESLLSISDSDHAKILAPKVRGYIKLLLWNSEGGTAAKWHRDFRELHKNVDFVFLQEITLNPENLNYFKNDSLSDWWHGATFSWSRDGSRKGVALGADAEPLTIRSIQSADLEFVLRTPKSSIVATYQVKGLDKPLMVVDTHALNFTAFSSYIKMIVAIEQIVENHPGPVIWAGDFNTWDENRRDFLLQSTKKMNLQHVVQGPSYSGWIGSLDHVFIRGLRFVAAQIENDVDSSDHKPIQVLLSFQKN